jgi:DNA-binding beta-propeller fold protein YncE
MALTPDGATLFASDANPSDQAQPSIVSAVFTSLMAPVARIETCVEPRGSLVSRDGRNQYSACLLSDQLVETSTEGLAVTRRMSLTVGREGPADERPDVIVGDDGACRPGDLVSSRDDGKLYVTCSARREVLEIDRENLRVTRRFGTGDGPYDADITADGSTLVVTLQGEQGVAVIHVPTGSQRRVHTSHPVSLGVTVSPDGRYAFVSNASSSDSGGSVDVIDLLKARLVTTAELHDHAGDLAFWKMEAAAP